MLRDLLNGVVSKEVARAIYGLVVDRRGKFDLGATQRLRARLRKERLKGASLGKIMGSGGHGGLSRPPRGVVEVWTEGDKELVRCVSCKEALCRVGEDWKEPCRVKLLPPAMCGPLMAEMAGHFLLQQLYCPSCGALLATDIVEKKKAGRAKRAK